MTKSAKSEETKSKVEGKNIARAKGWFSARHQTDEAHKVARLDWKIKEEGRGITALANSQLAALRTPLEQLKTLDKRLGFCQGAWKEREKLLNQLDYRALDCYKTWLINHNI